jgi:hypothetical protein
VKRSYSVLVVAVAAAGAVAPPPAVAQDVRGMVAVYTQLLADGLAELERQQGRVRETWTRVDAGSAAVVDAQRQGADLETLRADEERQQALEALLVLQLVELQRTRRDLLTNRAVMEAVSGAAATPAAAAMGLLSGTWELNVQPGLSGTAYLMQQGTLVSGTYELSGGWSGSLRGTLVANKVRLERIDSQLGFAAIFYGEVDLGADPLVIQGRWEATQLATGLPSAGGWRAQRKD